MENPSFLVFMGSRQRELLSVITAMVGGPLGTETCTAVGLGNIALTVSSPGPKPESLLELSCKGSLSDHKSRHFISWDISKVKSWEDLDRE
jgi:hypothetical protein